MRKYTSNLNILKVYNYYICLHIKRQLMSTLFFNDKFRFNFNI